MIDAKETARCERAAERSIRNEDSHYPIPDAKESQEKTKLEWALYFVRRGRPILPNKEGRKKPWGGDGCFERVLRTEEAVIKHFTRYPKHNVATTLDGWLVADVDCKSSKAGFESLEHLKLMGLITDGFAVETGSGGHQYHFRLAPGVTVADSVSKILPGIDIKSGATSQVLLPGSVIYKRYHPEVFTANGDARYRLLNGAPEPDAQNWFVDMCGEAGLPRARDADIPPDWLDLDSDRNIAAATRRLKEHEPLVIGQGADTKCYAAAARVRDQGVSEGTCLELVHEHLCNADWVHRRSRTPTATLKARSAARHTSKPTGNSSR
jgi:hypothetical protein